MTGNRREMGREGEREKKIEVREPGGGLAVESGEKGPREKNGPQQGKLIQNAKEWPKYSKMPFTNLAEHKFQQKPLK